MSLEAQPSHRLPVEHPAYKNIPHQDPDIDGTGQAWRMRALPPGTVGVVDWLVRDSAGIWYLVAVAKWSSGSSTHSLIIWALDPGQPLPDLDEQNVHVLAPSELFHLFPCRSDTQAKVLAYLLVEAACSGCPLYEENAPYWHQVIDATAEHLTYGCHPTNN